MNSEWEKFLAGYWTRTPPKHEGTYPIADVSGQQQSRTVVIFQNPTTQEWEMRPYWKGWFWSEPIPELPTPPEWSNDIT